MHTNFNLIFMYLLCSCDVQFSLMTLYFYPNFGFVLWSWIVSTGLVDIPKFLYSRILKLYQLQSPIDFDYDFQCLVNDLCLLKSFAATECSGFCYFSFDVHRRRCKCFISVERSDAKELGILLQLVLGCAVNSDDKHEYIRRIMQMEESVQLSVMKAIQEVIFFYISSYFELLLLRFYQWQCDIIGNLNMWSVRVNYWFFHHDFIPCLPVIDKSQSWFDLCNAFNLSW